MSSSGRLALPSNAGHAVQLHEVPGDLQGFVPRGDLDPATRMLPMLQQHMALAAETAGSVGADVTATTAGAPQGS